MVFRSILIIPQVSGHFQFLGREQLTVCIGLETKETQHVCAQTDNRKSSCCWLCRKIIVKTIEKKRGFSADTIYSVLSYVTEYVVFYLPQDGKYLYELPLQTIAPSVYDNQHLNGSPSAVSLVGIRQLVLYCGLCFETVGFFPFTPKPVTTIR